MSLAGSLLSADLQLAPLVHIASTLVLILGVSWLSHRTEQVAVTHWILEHVVFPTGRAAVLVGFILIAYPRLYGLEAAVPLSEILSAGAGRLQSLINWVFVVSLLLPLVPLIGGIVSPRRV